MVHFREIGRNGATRILTVVLKLIPLLFWFQWIY